MNEILKDKTFKEGFYIKGDDGLYNISLLKDKKPCWKLAEHFSKFLLKDDMDVIETPFFYEISNKGKVVTNKEGALTLSIECKEEYDHIREDGEAWPHLLIEQDIFDQKLCKMKRLEVSLDLDFNSLTSYMKKRNKLHTLQVSLYIAIGSRKEDSKGANDYLWFGLPLIDAPRYHKPKRYVSQDVGKEDCTNKLIYSIDPSLYMKDIFTVGDNLHFTIDILPYIKKAFRKAKSLNYLKYVDYKDMELLSTNFGFEATGCFSGSICINKISFKEEDL